MAERPPAQPPAAAPQPPPVPKILSRLHLQASRPLQLRPSPRDASWRNHRRRSPSPYRTFPSPRLWPSRPPRLRRPPHKSSCADLSQRQGDSGEVESGAGARSVEALPKINSSVAALDTAAPLPQISMPYEEDGVADECARMIQSMGIQHTEGTSSNMRDLLACINGTSSFLYVQRRIYILSMLISIVAYLPLREAPAVIQSYFDKRIVGCPGGEGEDEHDVVWFWLEKGKPHECPVCTQCFKLEVIGNGGNPDGHDDDDDHHHH